MGLQLDMCTVASRGPEFIKYALIVRTLPANAKPLNPFLYAGATAKRLKYNSLIVFHLTFIFMTKGSNAPTAPNHDRFD